MPKFSSGTRQGAPWLLLIGLACAGCIRVGDFSRNATRYNEAIEEAQNRMLLLNIVRSEMHRPMYITDLSKITGNIKLDFNTGGVETDYGPFVESRSDMSTTGTAMVTTSRSPAHYLFGSKFLPSLDYAHTPTFDVNVLSTQDFMNGFLKPASKDLLAYYWEQGWPRELLLYLFVKEVQIRSTTDPTELEEDYVNYPSARDGLAELEKFGHWVTEFVQAQPVFIRTAQGIGPCLDTYRVEELKDLVAAAKEGLGVSEVEHGRFQLQQAKPDLVLVSKAESQWRTIRDQLCSDPGIRAAGPKALARALDEAAGKCAEKLQSVDVKGAPEKWKEIDGRCQLLDEKLQGAPSCPAGCAGEAGTSGEDAQPADERAQKSGQISARYETKEAKLILRAPEGVLYYLGELMRVEEDQKHYVPEICVHGQLEPLFVAFGRNEVEKACPEAVAVTYGGSGFLIPEAKGKDIAKPGSFVCPKPDDPVLTTGNKYITGLDDLHCSAGRSMEALSLVTQLIALQKSAKDSPTTSVIRAIAQ